MYHETFRNRLFEAWLWVRHLGWMYAVALLVLGVVGYCAYALAVASPAVKLSVTLGAILVYNLGGEIYKRRPHEKEDIQKSKSMTIGGCILLLALPIAIYSLILSAFVVPWFISLGVAFGLIFAIVVVMFDKKKITIPKPIFELRNLVFIFTLISLAYYLAKYLGWF